MKGKTANTQITFFKLVCFSINSELSKYISVFLSIFSCFHVLIVSLYNVIIIFPLFCFIVLLILFYGRNYKEWDCKHTKMVLCTVLCLVSLPTVTYVYS